MVKITYEPYGAQSVLTFQGEPAEVAVKINHFANHGMFLGEAVPEGYDEKAHSRVTIAATTARIIPALASLASAAMIHSGESKQFKGNPVAFDAHASDKAREEYASWPLVRSVKVADEIRPDTREYQLGDDEIAPWTRKAGKRILASVAQIGLKRQ